ncbi:MAG: hypothetical protein ACREGA_04620 [Candidatus Saccharimonadales bacterium]
MILKRRAGNDRKPQINRDGRQPARSLPPRQANMSYSASRLERQNDTKRRPMPSDDKAAPGQPRLKQLPALMILLVLIIFGFYDIGLSRQPKIVILSGAKNSSLYSKSPAIYQPTAAQLMRQTGGSFSKITVNSAALAAKMQSRFPELKNVSVALPLLGRRPVFYLQPARPALILKTPNHKKYLLATSGKIMAMADSAQKFARLKVPIVLDQDAGRPRVAQQVLPSSDVAFIQLVRNQFMAKHIAISAMTLPPASDELDVQPGGVKYSVKFNLQDSQNAKAQIGDFLAARSYLKNHSQKPTNYIDARLPGRIYYK